MLRGVRTERPRAGEPCCASHDNHEKIMHGSPISVHT